MIRRILFLLLVSICSNMCLAHDHGGAMQFHENKGQWPTQVLYRALTPGGSLFVEQTGFTHVLCKGGPLEGHAMPDHVPTPLLMHAVRVHFEGGSPARGTGSHKMPHYANYFMGNDPSAWGTGCGVYAQVDLQEVYPGIGLRVDGHDGMKYDWLVAAGADPTRIVMRYEGHDALFLKEGLLFMKTTAGDVTEQRPVAWQVVDGKRVPVRCEYALHNDRLTFELPDGHDPMHPLVIDPVVVFSSYSGSFGNNWGMTATYDDAGHLYAGSMTFGTGYPVTTGVIQASFGLGTVDMTLTKFSPDGSTLVWSTYLGGSGNEVPHSLVVNSSEELYVLGTTGSANFPTTTGAFLNTFQGGTYQSIFNFEYASGSDIVLVHLNATATALIGSTYVGGAGNDGLNPATPLHRNYGDICRGEIILDANEHPLVVTSTNSTGLYTSPGAGQPVNAGLYDAYTFRMDPLLTTMEWATYHGGSGNDSGYSLQIATNGEVYITGGTVSTNLPVTSGAWSTTANGMADGYITRFAPTGSLLSSTYVGTAQYDQTYFVQLDTDDAVYVFGQTSGNYPVTPGLYANPQASQFIHKFSSDLGSSVWSTRIGGSGGENLVPTAFLVSNCEQIYLSAWGSNTNASAPIPVNSSTQGLPVTADAFQSNTNGGDFYLAMLEPGAESLGYATFFGGGTTNEHVDGGTSRFDKNGIIYQATCAGCWNSNAFPTTPGAWSNVNNASCNLGVFKIDFEQSVQVNISVEAGGEIFTSDVAVCLNEPITFSASGTAGTWIWDLGGGAAPVTAAQVEHTYTGEGSYEVVLIGIDESACAYSDTTHITITVQVPGGMFPSFEVSTTSSCQGFQVQMENTSTGDGLYLWHFGDGSTATTSDPVHFYPYPDTYPIVLELIDPVCPDTTSFTMELVLDPPDIPQTMDTAIAMCEGEPVILDAGPGHSIYLWSTGAVTQSILVHEPGTYDVYVADGICAGNHSAVVLGPPEYAPMEDLRICPGVSISLSPTFDPAFIFWNTGDTSATIFPEVAGLYWFEAIDEFGCLVYDTATVSIGEGGVIIPNVFSPNNDQVNDIFQVTGLALEEFSMEVFDRWGRSIFSATDPSRGWNGGINNSDPLNEGTYFYIISFRDRCTDDPLTTHQGHVMLVR